MNQNYGHAVDPDLAAQRANVLMESEIKARIDAVRELAQRQNSLEAALLEYETAYQAATRAGWQEDKLRDIGLRAPESSADLGGRRAAPSAPAAPAPAAQQAPAPAQPASAPQAPSLAPVVQLTPPPSVGSFAAASQSSL